MHELAYVHDWVLSLWLTGEGAYTIPHSQRARRFSLWTPGHGWPWHRGIRLVISGKFTGFIFRFHSIYVFICAYSEFTREKKKRTGSRPDYNPSTFSVCALCLRPSVRRRSSSCLVHELLVQVPNPQVFVYSVMHTEGSKFPPSTAHDRLSSALATARQCCRAACVACQEAGRNKP